MRKSELKQLIRECIEEVTNQTVNTAKFDLITLNALNLAVKTFSSYNISYNKSTSPDESDLYKILFNQELAIKAMGPAKFAWLVQQIIEICNVVGWEDIYGGNTHNQMELDRLLAKFGKPKNADDDF